MRDEEQVKTVSRVSWGIFIGYILFSLITFITIYIFDWARKLFELTEAIVKINAVWFSAFIAIYGVFAMRKNVRRAKLSNLPIRLDSQFLLVAAFVLFTIKEVIKLVVFYTGSDILTSALKNSVVVLNFGGYVSLFGSIYFGRKRKL